MAEAKILEVRKVLSTDPARVGKLDSIVVYSIDGSRTAFIVLSKDAPTEIEISEAVKKEEKSRSAVVGKSFKLD